jgi:enoyl-CoA hydratase/carnithine racemase
MSYEDIRFEIDAGIAVITLHRPEHMNTFSGRMSEELGRAYRECDANDGVRAVILTGAGNAFCAGADMSVGESTFAKQDEATFSAAGVDPPAWEVRKPVIAAVNGHAIGIGLTLALQCDLRILAEAGKYGVVQVRRGVMPDAYSHWTLPRLVGMAVSCPPTRCSRPPARSRATSRSTPPRSPSRSRNGCCGRAPGWAGRMSGDGRPSCTTT